MSDFILLLLDLKYPYRKRLRKMCKSLKHEKKKTNLFKITFTSARDVAQLLAYHVQKCSNL